MRAMETEPDTWIVDLGGGLVLEVLLMGGLAWAFWRWRGELLAEACVGHA